MGLSTNFLYGPSQEQDVPGEGVFPFYKAQPYELWTPKIDVCPESDITEH